MAESLSFFIPKFAWAATAGKQCSVFVSALRGDPLAFVDIGNILNAFALTIIIISAIYALLNLSLGGFQYITSGGDKLLVEHARQRITYAILGLAVVVSIVAINQVLGTVFGVNISGNIVWPSVNTIVGDFSASSCN